MTIRSLLALVASLILGAAAAPAMAEPAPPAQDDGAPGLRVDAEVDPTAYVLNGYSLHVGVGHRRLRVDLGAFAMQIPAAIHGNEGFTQSFDGFGAKLQYFLFAEQRGGFVGIDGGLAHVLVQRNGTGLASRQTQINVGVNAGWRFSIAANLYATAWLGVGRALGADDVMLGDARFDSQPWTVFPAIHVGYRFQ